MEEVIQNLTKELEEKITKVATINEVQELKNEFIGKNGKITELNKGMRDVSPEDRPKIGALIHSAKVFAEEKITEIEKNLEAKALSEKLLKEDIDVTLDKKHRERGAYHPFSLEAKRLGEILTGMGFSQIDGPEIDYDKFNFELLNVPKDHPARDMQDTYYITNEILLRTQTSNTQPRAMQNLKPPFKVFSYGMVFRKDDIDATHTASFNQLEGIYIDENVGLADLKIMLEKLIKEYYGDKAKIRFRSSFFPFTEPSVEVDMVCSNCGGKGCEACKGVGGFEILGAGMVHPNVLEANGIDSKKYSGYAFGLGFDRFVKDKYKVPFSPLFYENDIRFLKQFK